MILFGDDAKEVYEKAKEVIRPRVEKGIAFMDEYHPGWDKKIVLQNLQMESCYNCIGGQVLGDYMNLSSELSRIYQGSVYGADFGFDFSNEPRASGVSPFDEYAILEDLWTEEIQKRNGEE